ncbi:MAG: hypothetical protein V4465_01620 [Patescibacteria group bacterium]
MSNTQAVALGVLAFVALAIAVIGYMRSRRASSMKSATQTGFHHIVRKNPKGRLR